MVTHTQLMKHRRYVCCTWDQDKASGAASRLFSLNSARNGQGFSMRV
ncbi:hypothetical protein RI103_29350 [Paraburkholderia sp. FT54]|nr:hypothetical protein [Paraburkholderia sp. FT54]WNC92375.1 hypothetical protein RI103_29350 [Paraburkholderia sp. FT54]